MISKSLNWSAESRQEPFLLKPSGKDYLWGGSRLKDDFAKEISLTPLAETWECSTHPDGPSTVASGKFRGRLLTDVLKEHPELLGTHPKTQGELPILVKLIDADKNLSIQVHPSDEYARKYENGALGKTEMWYVLDAKPGARLIYGFVRNLNKTQVKKHIADGTLENVLQKVPIKKNDVFFIPAGCVHAIGAGALIAEIQENSNLTYRLYDYNRLDKNGEQRPLHIEKALEVADLKGAAEPRQPMRVLKFTPGFASELLCRCQYFQVERLLLNTERCRNKAKLRAAENSFVTLLCTSGCGTISWNDNKVLEFYKGDCIFVPANSAELRFHGQAQFLKVGC